MTGRAARVTIGVLLALCIVVPGGHASGLFFGVEAYTLDLSATWPQVPVAAAAAFDELETLFADQGASPAELAEISEDFDRVAADLEDAVSVLPDLVPIPLAMVGIEFSLPWIVIDGARISVGFLDDRLVRGIATGIAGISIPDPLIDATIDVGDESATLTADLAFSTWMVSIDATKRFDLLVLGFDLLLGLDYLGGNMTPAVGVDVPAEWEDGVDAALAALHLDEISWGALTAHAGIGIEFGLPFLRLYAEGRFVLPIAQAPGWWSLRAGNLAGAVGMVIRF